MMNRFGKWLATLSFVLLAACSTHNPFENSDSNWRIDGTFVDYKVAGLPGVYLSTGSSTQAQLEVTEDGRIELFAPISEAAGCQLRVVGELVSVRKVPASGMNAAGDSRDFRFGAFKGTYKSANTHVMVVLTDLFEDTDPMMVSIEKIYQGEVIQTISHAKKVQKGESPEEAKQEKGSVSSEPDPLTACSTWDISNNYDYSKRLYLQPIEWNGGEVIVDGVILQRE